jgi:D-arabinose 1-dehydrogenase-like Zn-dependent alcohol dehydrogenase
VKAAVITEYGKPWEMRDVPEPTPGPGQVLLRIRACGMCGAEVHIQHGHFRLRLPCVAGHEPVGTVTALGPGVTTLREGDRVGVSWTQRGCGRCATCHSGRPKYCASAQTWMQMGGGFAESMLAWAEGCTPVPSSLDDVTAAPIFCAGFTVLSGLRNAHPRAGERVAVLGIGGLGHLAIQFAAVLGFETIAVTNSADKAAEALRFGASDVIVAGADTGAALTKVGGADVILSTTNSAKQVSQAIGGLRPEGRLVSMGALDGPIQVDSIQLIMRQVRIVGSTQNDRADLVDALDMAAKGKVKPATETFPLDDVNTALDRLESGKMRYRGVLLPA